MKLPEDDVDWLICYDERCYFYDGRDCPGCLIRCARIGKVLPSDR